MKVGKVTTRAVGRPGGGPISRVNTRARLATIATSLLLVLMSPQVLANTPRLGQPRVFASFDKSRPLRVTVVPLGRRRALLHIEEARGTAQAFMTTVKIDRSKRPPHVHYTLPRLGAVYFSEREKRTQINGTWQVYAEVYLGRRVIRVRASAVDSAAAEQRKATLWRSYRQAQGLDLSAKQRQRRLREATVAVRKACRGPALKVSVDQRAFQAAGVPHRVGAAAVYLRALSTLCQTDADYRSATRGLRQMRFVLASATATSIRRKGDTLTVPLSTEDVNVYSVAQRAFRDSL